jgi:hypothetical protein
MRRIPISYGEVREMPVMYRNWFIKRYIREVDEAKANQRKSASAQSQAEAAASTLESRLGKLSRSF